MLDLLFNPGKIAALIAGPIGLGALALLLVFVLFGWLVINAIPWGHEDAFRWFIGEPYRVPRAKGEYGEMPEGNDPSMLVEWFGGHISQGVRPGHVALDFGIPVGTPVRTTMGGEVVYAGYSSRGYGNLVIVKNGDYTYYYAHLDGIDVQVGDQVDTGTVVGPSGNTGTSTAPHLHYEVRHGNTPIDPTTAPVGEAVNPQQEAGGESGTSPSNTEGDGEATLQEVGDVELEDD